MQEMPNVKVKLVHELAQVPSKANPDDAGYDCIAVSMKQTGKYIEYDLGIQLEIPVGYKALVYPRSSISKYDLTLANGVGVVDAGYRGNVTCRFKQNFNGNQMTMFPEFYKIGDKVCQLVFEKVYSPELEVVEQLDLSNDRGGGYGSSDNKSRSQDVPTDTV